MDIGSYLRETVTKHWNNKERVVEACAKELGRQLWDNDPMYGRIRDRDDHELKIAKLGLALGTAATPEEFLAVIEKIETPTEAFTRALASSS